MIHKIFKYMYVLYLYLYIYLYIDPMWVCTDVYYTGKHITEREGVRKRQREGITISTKVHVSEIIEIILRAVDTSINPS